MSGGADSVSSLAACLRKHAGDIQSSWRARVTADPTIPTENLGPRELDDHIPELLERICATLDEFALWRDDAEARGDLAGSGPPAAQHARVRLREGYVLAQILHELRHLREAIVDVCEQELVHIGGDGARIVHGAIDAAMFVAAVGGQGTSQLGAVSPP